MEDDNNKEMLELAENTDTAIEWTGGTDGVNSLAKSIKRKRQLSFLRAFEACGNISQASKAIGVNAASVRNWREQDEWFRKQFADSLQGYHDSIEQEIHNRAIIGEEVAIIGKVQTPAGPEDAIIGHKRVKSDLLLMFHAKRHIREYRDKYEPDSENEKPSETVSPMTRVLVRIETMSTRQTESLPPGPVIDIVVDQTKEGE